MSELMPARIPGPPGVTYEAHWGRRTARSRTFIGRVHELVRGGGMQVFACDHAHPDKAAGQDCARAAAEAIARREIAAQPAGPQALDTGLPSFADRFADSVAGAWELAGGHRLTGEDRAQLSALLTRAAGEDPAVAARRDRLARDLAPYAAIAGASGPALAAGIAATFAGLGIERISFADDATGGAMTSPPGTDLLDATVSEHQSHPARTDPGQRHTPVISGPNGKCDICGRYADDPVHLA